MMILTAGCGVCKHTPIEKSDSIRIEYRDRIVHDTARVEVPKEVERIVTRDTVSHIENSWAKSDAMVSDGFLHHSLESKPRVIKVPVEVQVRDTIIMERTAEVVKVEVEKPLTWWQRTKMGTFGWLLGGIVLLLLWTFRKPIIKLIRI